MAKLEETIDALEIRVPENAEYEDCPVDGSLPVDAVSDEEIMSRAILLHKENGQLRQELDRFKRVAGRRRKEILDMARRDLLHRLLPVMDEIGLMLSSYSERPADALAATGAALILKKFTQIMDEQVAANSRMLEQLELQKQEEGIVETADDAPLSTISNEETVLEDLRSSFPGSSAGKQEAETRPRATSSASGQSVRRSRPVISRLDDDTSQAARTSLGGFEPGESRIAEEPLQSPGSHYQEEESDNFMSAGIPEETGEARSGLPVAVKWAFWLVLALLAGFLAGYMF